MPELLAALAAFLQEHRRCGDLDGGVDDELVWMACECGASVVRRLDNSLARGWSQDVDRPSKRR